MLNSNLEHVRLIQCMLMINGSFIDYFASHDSNYRDYNEYSHFLLNFTLIITILSTFSVVLSHRKIVCIIYFHFLIISYLIRVYYPLKCIELNINLKSKLFINNFLKSNSFTFNSSQYTLIYNFNVNKSVY